MQDRLYEVLKGVEFINLGAYTSKDGPVCPWCGATKGMGHTDYCLLKQALKDHEYQKSLMGYHSNVIDKVIESMGGQGT